MMRAFPAKGEIRNLLVLTMAFVLTIGGANAQNVAKIGTTEYATLQAAVDDAYDNMTGDVTISLTSDITAYTVIKQKADLNLTIDGNNKTYTIYGQIFIDGMGRSTGTETLTIAGVKFEGDGTGSGFYSGNNAVFVSIPGVKKSGAPYYRNGNNYAHNVTVSNCSFTSTASTKSIVGVKIENGGGVGYNTVLTDVVGDNLHSLAQVNSTDGGGAFTNCTATNSKSFINFAQGQGATPIVISGCSFSSSETESYAVRMKSNSGLNIVLSNNDFTADNVIWLGEGDAPSGTINVESGNYNGEIHVDMTAAGTGKIVLTGGTFSEPVATVQGYCAEGYTAYDNNDGTCTVGEIIVAKIGETGYPTLNAAAAAVPVGTPTTITILTNLNFYDIAQSSLANKTITFTGAATDTLTLTNAAHAQTNASGADLTFENITLKNDNTADVYRGIIHVNKVTINNCEILGFMMGYAKTLICNNCTFTASCKFHMWTYGSDCTFNGCTFNSSYSSSGGKAINVYTDQTFDRRVITFDNCAFNATSHSGNGSAIQINSQYTCFVIYVNNCTVSGYANSESTAVSGYEDLANNKSTSTKTTLYIDGVRVLNQGSCEPVAKIGDTYYSTLQAALDDAYEMTGDVTINIISDEINTYSVIREKNGLNLTIEGNDHTLDGQLIVNGMGLGLSGTGTVTIQNLNFNGDNTNFYSGTDAFILMPKPANIPSPYNTNTYNYANNVTIDNCDFTSTSANLNLVALKVTSAAGAYNVAITNCTGDNLHSLAQLTGTTGSTLDHCVVTNSDSYINIDGGAGDHNISNCKFISSVSDGYGIREKGSSGAIITLVNDTITAANSLVLGKNDAPLGSINVERGVYNGTLANNQNASGKAIFSFTGGIFDEDSIVKLLEIPDDRELIAITPLGYPDDAPQAPKRKTVEELLEFK